MENKIDITKDAIFYGGQSEDENTSVETSTENNDKINNDKIDFIGQGSYSCVFRPAIKCNNTIDPNDPNDKFFVSKISKKDKYIENEFHISSIIQQVPRYYHYFSPILENCDADLYELGSTTAAFAEFKKCNLFIENGDIIKKDNGSMTTVESGSGNGSGNGSGSNAVEYIYNKIRYVGHKDLYSYLEEHENEWKDAFTYLSYSISLLREKGIVHYDFKGNNVMVHDKHHTPIIIDFGLSIDINQTIRGDGGAVDTEDRLRRAFYVYSTDYEVWCPEIVFICYFTQERKSALSEPITIDDIDFVCNDFMKNNGIFGEQYFNMDEQKRENYRASMHSFFSAFLNRSATETIIEITETYYNTWDMYSLVVCFQSACTIPLPDEYIKFISADPRERL